MECQTSCLETENCNYFTFRQSDNACVLYYNCTNIGDSNCPDCFTGEKECHICQQPGECEGNIVTITSTSTVEDCEMECFDDSECQWYTFDLSLEYCFLTSTCSPKNTSTLSVFGQKYCYQDNSGGNSSNHICKWNLVLSTFNKEQDNMLLISAIVFCLDTPFFNIKIYINNTSFMQVLICLVLFDADLKLSQNEDLNFKVLENNTNTINKSAFLFINIFWIMS